MRANRELNQTSRVEREERIARQIAPNLARTMSDVDRAEILAGRFTPGMVAIADREGASRGALFAALVTELTQEHA